MTDDVTALRPRMMSVAYRMLGSVADAEDAVQDAFVRYQTAGGVSSPEGFLVRTTTRLCIDRLRERKRREYVGPWVPEPVETQAAARGDALAESLTQAFLLLLERLTLTDAATRRFGRFPSGRAAPGSAHARSRGSTRVTASHPAHPLYEGGVRWTGTLVDR